MDFINGSLKVLISVILFILIIKIFMEVANYICKQLGFDNLFIGIWQKVRELWQNIEEE